MLYQTFLLVVNDRVGHFSLSLILGISRSCSGRTFLDMSAWVSYYNFWNFHTPGNAWVCLGPTKELFDAENETHVSIG